MFEHTWQSRAACAATRADAAVDGEYLPYFWRELRRNRSQVGIGNLVKLELVGLAKRDELAGDFMRITERHALLYQPLGNVGRQAETLWR